MKFSISPEMAAQIAIYEKDIHKYMLTKDDLTLIARLEKSDSIEKATRHARNYIELFSEDFVCSRSH